ncbi:MAG: proline dehydrogenase family protein [Acidobacteriota bacterium]
MAFFDRLLVASMPLVPRFLIRRVAARYVAGETLDDAIATIRELNAEGAMATLDLLGEEVSERRKAEASTDEYLRVLDAIEDHGLDSNVSVKPTMLGLKIDEVFCAEQIEKLVRAAQERDNFVRLDMEDRSCTDATLRLYDSLHERFGHVGVVLQAYMRRTLADIDRLPIQDANVRICKGIYVEPRQVAWKGYETVRANYLAALEKMLRRGVYVGIATHDEYLACAATALIDRLQVPRDRYEFQMLLGVDGELRRILLAEGHRLRVYVPYGRDWYPYTTRRLRENPEIARHVTVALLRRRGF